MNSVVIAITLFILALLIGVEVIGKVPATLHTPLMSGANSIHGIVIVGVVIIAAEAHSPLSYVLIFLAAVLGAMNVVGGYVVTDRMLEMFKSSKPDKGKKKAGQDEQAPTATTETAKDQGADK
ncbi:NAD(P) transhydrogenase subunit alpha [Bifidobacterium sp. W8101]|uniref:NAD(P) transhydrogenase subunit alpha n=1 Tax=Bifidobacterium TaxID=1678 RepID=UPI0018DE57B5|nr:MULTISPECIES: NAD(P) transhydrogenase subunit alpha [Bifidobacterium]MBI0126716.1 NAD(P) transhydrogenase subunit alpha [Bifidobacterium choladohabitans]MBI0128285.1 NAD(P) transhydrogenase subunit alpha [Bifidobacterium sp. W8103]MBI0138872.1 NAD(P) transhydrogenase subunit alpha [Bifidobacterium sp. W8105]MBI0148158.1 NAD(P) transhydrogenase subunit alpha [Bifidobacterium sp. W8107]